ncbi:hypothetical protein [Cupriavidus sp. D39]|uniref:hypothetical protein n=1 Tax=Cupriavidus sp. D39 TaxID=2997877 RepID=UPI00226FB627|nr:hypothetical protein [Cupriavidus sp. D39]MCY0854730.1 hypothetical protein [Cupriavidus sp. D39]
MNRRQFLNQSNTAIAVTAIGASGAATAAAPTSQSPQEPLTMNSPHLYDRLAHDNAVLLLVDHQVGLYTGVRDIETLELSCGRLTAATISGHRCPCPSRLR